MNEKEKGVTIANNVDDASVPLVTYTATEPLPENNEVERFIARIGQIFYSKINVKNLWSKQKIFKAYNESFMQTCKEFRK